VQASLDALDLGRLQATQVARLVQEAQALLGKFVVCAVRFPIG
jgi:hypothetical protein